jgi:signal transduction histidine kinase
VTAPLVVVVEDDDDLRGFIADVLGRDYRVSSARDGESGLTLINAVRPDAVVSDVAMPRMNGYEMSRRLRAQDEHHSLPILLLTAYRDVGRVLEGFDAGADDYLAKPFYARELLARVSVHVRLRRMARQLAHQERLASLGVLATSLAHQIRNSLVIIVAGLPAIERKLGAMDARVKEVLDGAIQSAGRIERIVDDLMLVSRAGRATSEAFKPASDIDAVVRLIGVRQGAQASSLTIETDVDPEITLYGPPGEINHIFLSLIDNAVKAAGKGGVVHVRGRRAGVRFVLEVADSGAGVDAVDVESIFKPFWTSRAPGEGTGLGLAIAREIALRQGGDLKVGRSELGGALFTMTLPMVD